MTVHPLPGQPEQNPFGRRINEMHEEQTDEDGFYRGHVAAVEHVIGEDVPDNAHWKGWVW